MDIDQVTRDPGDRFRVDGYPGVAFYVHDRERAATEDTWWDGIEEETGRVLMVIVGDDRTFAVEPDDLTPLEREDYCSECGQIGCGHGA
jgi:hypothetical protein